MVNKSPESRPGFAELLPVGQGVQDAAGDIRPDDDFGVVRGGSEVEAGTDKHNLRAAVFGRSLINPFMRFTPDQLDMLHQAYLAYSYADEEKNLATRARKPENIARHSTESKMAFNYANQLTIDLFDINEGSKESDALALTSIRAAMIKNHEQNIALIEETLGIANAPVVQLPKAAPSRPPLLRSGSSASTPPWAGQGKAAATGDFQRTWRGDD